MMPRLLPFLLVWSFFQSLTAQSNENSIRNSLDSCYLTGRFRQGFAICDKALRDSSSLSPSLYSFVKMKQGLFYKEVDKYNDGLAPLKLAKLSLEKQGDTLSALYIETIQHYSFLLASNTQWDLSEQLAKKALQLAELQLGKRHPLYALALFHVGYTHNHRRQYVEAERYYKEALQLQIELLGKYHRDCAQTFHFLGSLNFNQNKNDQAQFYFEEALTIRLKILDPDHPRIVASCMNRGVVYNSIGEVEKAEIWYKKAIEAATLLGEYGLFGRYIASYNLSNLYLGLGRIDESQNLIKQLFPLIIKIQSAEHPNYLMNLEILAYTYQRQGNYPEAEKIFKEALNLRERILGRQHPHFAQNLGALGNLYLEKKDWPAAVSMFSEATGYMEKIQGAAHPDYANNLFNWGYALVFSGQKEEGLAKAQMAYQILEKAYGKEHLNFVRTQYRMATLFISVNRSQEAFVLAKAAGIMEQKLLMRAATYFSENDLETYTFEFLQDLSRQFTLLNAEPSLAIRKDKDGVYFNGLLFYKGFVAQRAYQLRSYIQQQKDTALKTKLLHWQQLHRQIGQEYAKTDANRNAKLSEWEASAVSIEKTLAQDAKEFVNLRQEVKWEDVQKKLKGNEAAIEFFQYQPNLDDSLVIYGAAIIRSNWDAPELINLCPAKQLSQVSPKALQTWNRNQRGIEPIRGNPLQDIYQLIWKPLEEKLAGVKTIYYAPVGALNSIPLHALPTDKKEQLIGNRYQLVLMSSTRNLVEENQKIKTMPQNAFLVGGVNYNKNVHAAAGNEISSSTLRSHTVLRGNQSTDGGGWANLLGSAQEIVQIDALMRGKGVKTTLLMDSVASEENIKKYLATPQNKIDVIHFATHGFAFPDVTKRSTFHYSVLQNPLLRTGLVLAGANELMKKDTSQSEDGILTAFEITGFNVQGTQLVVLSACDSGLGEVRREEGVFGLSRAFKMAGAKALLLSLWEAPDEETAVFMSNFYRYWLKGMSMRKAFWKTRFDMKKKYTDPYLWAGFVLWE